MASAKSNSKEAGDSCDLPGTKKDSTDAAGKASTYFTTASQTGISKILPADSTRQEVRTWASEG
jgi:hypothetical protein